ncbi:low affinity iron permease family protein [Phenylobacterium sp.]|jgi:low affinity Fe/Cu permease|uniref:low affinity iron permease family protein n=1 Tax=Phenylobacterium sp. TaxID=1871053 RepID=UPI002F937FAF
MGDLDALFSRIASAVSRWTGRPAVFLVCCAVVVAWAVSGPMFGFSDTWQLVINTGTTIATFLMVFLIQNTQNRDNAALQAKLDELIRVSKAKNDFIGIEHLSDRELEEILTDCERHRPHVIDRAEANVRRERRKAQAPKRTASMKPLPARRRA